MVLEPLYTAKFTVNFLSCYITATMLHYTKHGQLRIIKDNGVQFVEYVFN